MRYTSLTISHETLAAGTGALDSFVSVTVDGTNQGEFSKPADEVAMISAKDGRWQQGWPVAVAAMPLAPRRRAAC